MFYPKSSRTEPPKKKAKLPDSYFYPLSQSSFVGAIAVADLVKTTLGPRGMDKILVPVGSGPQSKHINVTNDGATILRSMHVDNPAAKILIDISKTQDE